MALFRRRRSRVEDRQPKAPGQDFETAPGTDAPTGPQTLPAGAPAPRRGRHLVPEEESRAKGPVGPFDAGQADMSLEGYVDFGSLRLRPAPGAALRYNPQHRYVELIYPELPARLRLEVLAAPKSSSLWDTVRADTMLSIARGAGASVEADSEWGPFLQAQMQTGRSRVGVPVRHYGIDGPRWLLLVTTYDRAAMDDALCSRLLHEILDGCIVVRGKKPYPPGEALELSEPFLHTAAGQRRPLQGAAS